MQRHKASELHGSDFLDAAATAAQKQILKGYLNHQEANLSLHFEFFKLEKVFFFVLLWYWFVYLRSVWSC